MPLCPGVAGGGVGCHGDIRTQGPGVQCQKIVTNPAEMHVMFGHRAGLRLMLVDKLGKISTSFTPLNYMDECFTTKSKHVSFEA